MPLSGRPSRPPVGPFTPVDTALNQVIPSPQWIPRGAESVGQLPQVSPQIPLQPPANVWQPTGWEGLERTPLPHETLIDLAKTIDYLTGQPVREALAGSLREGGKGGSLKGALSGFLGSFGKHPDESVTGKDIALEMGLSGRSVKQSRYGEMLPDVSPAGAAGLGIEMGLDLTNFAPGLGLVAGGLKKAGKGAGKELPSLSFFQKLAKKKLKVKPEPAEYIPIKTQTHKIEVFKNPKQGDIDYLNQKFRREYPQSTGESVKVRTTYDEKGNKYSWMSGDAMHQQVEDYIFQKTGRKANQQENWFIDDYAMELRKEAFDKSTTPPTSLADEGIPVYHGSPYQFDQFSMKHIGEGEGAQTFGHGLYFTDEPAIAKEYAEYLGDPDILYKGKSMWEPGTVNTAEESYALKVLANETFDLDEALRFNDWEMKQAKEKGQSVDFLKKVRENIKKFHKEAEFKPKGYVYKARIPKGDYLKWDEPITRTQAEKIVEIAEKEGFKGWDLTVDNLMDEKAKGRSVYNLLSVVAGRDPVTGVASDPAKVSKLLHKAGIQGVEYPAGSLSGVKNSKAKNYVTFSDKGITIEEMRKLMLLLGIGAGTGAMISNNNKQGNGSSGFQSPDRLNRMTILEGMRGY